MVDHKVDGVTILVEKPEFLAVRKTLSEGYVALVRQPCKATPFFRLTWAVKSIISSPKVSYLALQ